MVRWRSLTRPTRLNTYPLLFQIRIGSGRRKRHQAQGNQTQVQDGFEGSQGKISTRCPFLSGLCLHVCYVNAEVQDMSLFSYCFCSSRHETSMRTVGCDARRIGG